MASKTSTNHATHGSAKSSIKSKSKFNSSSNSISSRSFERKDGDISNTSTIDEESIILEPNDYSIGRFLSDPTISNPQSTYSTIEESIQAHIERMKMELKNIGPIYSQEQATP